MNTQNQSKKLNLGAGEFPKEGYLNIDFTSMNEPDIRHNLNEFPYPFPDNYFELIEADHLLEHLENAFAVLKELHRIAQPNATIRIRVPHFSRGFTHADHKRGFDVTFPLYFDPSFQPGYQKFNLKLQKMTLHWFAQPYMKKKILPAPVYYIGRGLGALLDLLANISPWLCSRLWCFWVGGFEEIEFTFLVDK